MSVIKAVSYVLLNNAGVQALVSTRVYPDVAPQREVRPSIVLLEISRIPSNTLGVGGTSKMDISRVQIMSASLSRDISEQINDAVRAALDDLNNTTISGISIGWSRYESGNAYFDQISDQDGLYVTNSDYKIAYNI